jgi:hypothetical protein
MVKKGRKRKDEGSILSLLYLSLHLFSVIVIYNGITMEATKREKKREVKTKKKKKKKRLILALVFFTLPPPPPTLPTHPRPSPPSLPSGVRTAEHAGVCG